MEDWGNRQRTIGALKRGDYKQLFDTSPIGYVIYEEDGRIVTANKAFGRMVGGDFSFGQSENFMDFILPADRGKLSRMMERLLDARKTDTTDLSIKGERKTIEATVTSSRYMETPDEGSQQLPERHLFWSAITDITDLKEKQLQMMEQSLRDSLTGMYNRHFFDDFMKTYDEKAVLPLVVAMVDIDGLKMINDSLGHTFGDRAIVKVAQALKKYAVSRYLLMRTGGDEIVIFFRETELEEAHHYMNRVKEEIENCMLGGLPLSFSWGYAVKRKPEERLMTTISAAEDMMYSRKLLHSTGKKYETIDLILRTLFQRNTRIYRHSQRVSQLAGAFGKYLGYDQEKVRFMQQLGYLHDIGMASISDEVLNKKSLLNTSQIQEIRRHSETGYRILRSVPEMHEMAKIVLFHHENWDGSGYPYQVAGEDIPSESRFLMIVDAYDRMKYGYYGEKKENDQEIICELEQWSGRQFDPWMEKKFVRWMRQGQVPVCNDLE